MLRQLRFGMTWHAVIDDYKDVSRTAIMAAESVGAIGPCNVQIIKDKNGVPCVIEINARFSSTTIFRAKLGFNEALASIDYFLKNKRPRLTYKKGTIMRLFDELIVPTSTYKKLKTNGIIKNI